MVELIARRYGQALFELAMESGSLPERETEIRSMVEILEADSEFIEVLALPKITNTEKLKLIEDVFSGKVSDDLVGFLVLAIQKGRQENIVDILKYTLAKVEEHNGYLTAYVTSAVTLNDSDKDAIIKRLESQTKQKITLVTSVDESLIGGLFIRINDRIVDNTVKETIHRMARDVYEAKV